MEIIRPFSVEEPEQSKFEQAFLKMVQEFIKDLPRIEISELEKDRRCMICQHEYGLEILDTDTIEEAEEAVRLPCGHLAGRECISTWLESDDGDSCPMCRKTFFRVAPWPHIIPDEKDWKKLKVPYFDDIYMTLYRADYTLENIGGRPRGISSPRWIVRAAGRYHEDNPSLDDFLRDHEFRRTFARKILSTSPPEVENAAWMLQTYPELEELEAHVETLATVLETADPKGVIYIQLRDGGGATIFQVDTHTYSHEPYQDEGIFRNLVLRGALDGPPLIEEGRQGSWWTYYGDGDDFSTNDLCCWTEGGVQVSDFDSELDSDFDEGADDPDSDDGFTAEADAAFSGGSDDEGDGINGDQYDA